ncbi:PDR/VanB family oxidoreductase [Rhodococcus tibetensis]|uniref:PDR/VanB family oxidoreductase n=1 Tax=Rhodococcus tibetensis TaxID=2965064 RepID=A0ABT1QGX6_9NOCA|nr:PDR/VanB family oxidoreductase [Rhodococcus sp. FXJ9.536]MCQ4120372.1 PDR/VanB family oxidoreductase [Rhodococcus sp. FXJ9.536]
MPLHRDTELELELATKTTGADGVVVLELRDPAGTHLPAWTPGAHIDLVLTPELTRQYSLCGDPADTRVWRVAVLREAMGRGGSQFVHDKLSPGDRVTVRGPRNHFELEPSPRYVFIAGGIGITPILAMVASAENAGAEWTLVYGGRSRGSMAFADTLVERFGDKVMLCPADEHSRIDLPALLGTVRESTLIYCCGPTPLLDAVTEHCDTWPSGTLHVERFTAKDLDDPVRSGSFEVELTLSGKTITVTPEQSVLQAVTAAGVNVISSCEEGTCGTCETPVLGGTVDHRDSLLTPEEQAANDTMMICVSRATCPRLTLEI